MPRLDREWLEDMLEASAEVRTYVASVDFDAFVADSMRRNATLQQLSVIGETAARLSSDLRRRHPEVDWASMIGFRNVAVHSYFRITWTIIWETATRDAPILAGQIAAILTREFPEPVDDENERGG